ncbi:gastrula zinc finger protein XlCGF26.1-like isoform X3 [Vanessa tameamea]|uniref:Gastrula zinc finger protein XlCGF26.1-like isoform X3 n=1 Tax=Vanessa tameamea TaxID=334116 RepID=A0A8B8HYU8_VANTA|nr:gastrula zinc finger protein XlCGF26.1-like isoform X2 [Vanessa tameamea]
MGKSKRGEYLYRCKCCLDEVGLKNMWTEYYRDGEREIYGEMLTDCFALSWEQPPGDTEMEHICETCVSRLRDAINFKKEILYTEHLILEQLKNVTTEHIKQEEESEDEIETEYLSIEFLEDDNERDESDIKIERPQVKQEKDVLMINRRSKKYTDDDLEKCLEAVRTKALSQNKASILYSVPRKAISSAIARRQLLEDTENSKKRRRPDLQKRQENVDYIMKYTNATPFKGFVRTGYGCFFCSVEYEKPTDLKEHTLVEHFSENMLRVNIISDRSVKLDLTDLMCKVCEESIDSLENLLDHLRLEHNIKINTDVHNHLVPFKFESDTLKCAVCSEEFLSFKVLNDHVNLNHYKNYACEECGRGFINKRSLQSHGYRHETGVFTCQFCAKVFTTRIRRLDHERSVHMFNNKRHKCGYCGEKFIDIAKKKEHEVVVHSAAKLTYNCQACSKTYNSQKSLRTHIRSFHLMLRPFKCTYCNLGFYKNIELKKHMVKHTGEKDYQCVVCNKAYGRKSTLREHMRIHANDRRFKCELCGQAFVQKCSWRGHMRAKHGEQV